MIQHDVRSRIIYSADKFGYRNQQQLRQLISMLNKYDSQFVFEGLISFFKETHDMSSVRQELAGRLLYSINPKADFDLYNEIKGCLSYFDLSVEHLPFYFVEQCGFKNVQLVLESFSLDLFSDRENKSLSTMKFWIKNYDEWKLEHN